MISQQKKNECQNCIAVQRQGDRLDRSFVSCGVSFRAGNALKFAIEKRNNHAYATYARLGI